MKNMRSAPKKGNYFMVEMFFHHVIEKDDSSRALKESSRGLHSSWDDA